MRTRLTAALVALLLPPLTVLAAPSSTQPVVAVFQLGPITESQSQDFSSMFAPPQDQPRSLREIVRRMNAAADDGQVKAVVILADAVRAGPAQIEELRQAMHRCRDKGKDVLVHADSMQMFDYLLYSGASRISVVPHGDLWVAGIRFETLYLRGLLDKIGVQPDFLHNGAYKSASEMFMRDGPSPEADSMHNWLIDGYFQSAIDQIARGRKVSGDHVKKWLDAGPLSAEQAKELGMIDAIEQREDFDATLKQKYGQRLIYERKYGEEKQASIDFCSPFGILKFWGELLGGGEKKQPSTRPSVAIVYVDGMIVPGHNHGGLFGSSLATSTEIRKALDEAARDDSVKAVVMRIDSPGGSAVASEIILDASRRVREKKPLIVSMGNVAGSGGYYVTCAADTIFANETTLTASIGVVAGKLVTTDMWKKVGITFKSYQRGEMAGLLSSEAPFNDAERKHLTDWMTTIYGTFKQHVTDARGKKLTKPLEELAEGRVFTGKQALAYGLIDKLGTMQDAIHFAAEKAKLGGEDDYDVRVIPREKNPVEQLMAAFTGGSDEDQERDSQWLSASPASAYSSLTGQAMPYLSQLDPARVAAVRAALSRLELLGDEHVVLTMPEVYVRR